MDFIVKDKILEYIQNVQRRCKVLQSRYRFYFVEGKTKYSSSKTFIHGTIFCIAVHLVVHHAFSFFAVLKFLLSLRKLSVNKYRR